MIDRPLAATLCALLAANAAAATPTDVSLLNGSPLSNGGNYGYSVATQGGLSVVGSILDGQAGPNAGAAFLFDRSGDQVAKLVGDDTAPGDQFGSAVAMDDGVVVVGARFYGPGPGLGSGAAYLFDATTGNQLQKLSASDGGDPDDEYFGHTVAIGDGLALVGAHQDWLGTSQSDAGSVYVYDVETGAELRKLRAPDASGGDFFGFSVALGDGLAVIGSPFDDDRGDKSGSAYFFDLATGDMLRKITPEDGKAGDHFGYSVAVADGKAVVGAGGTGAASNPGAAYLFDLSTGDEIVKWSSGVQNQQDQFGETVAIDGSTALVGAPGYNGGRGAVFLFDTETGTRISSVTTPSRVLGGEYGYSVAIDGSWVVVGETRARTTGGTTGSAYRYEFVPEPHSAALVVAAGAALASTSRGRRPFAK